MPHQKAKLQRAKFYGAALAVLASLAPVTSSRAQIGKSTPVERLKATIKVLTDCYVSNTKKLAAAKTCEPPDAVVKAAMTACAPREKNMLEARRLAEMDSNASVLADFRDGVKRPLLSSVSVVRLTGGLCQK